MKLFAHPCFLNLVLTLTDISVGR